jgi:hypothetical protein
MAGDAASTAANKVNPSDEQLNQLDKPAEDNTWHDVPDLSKENLKNQAKTTYDKRSPLKKKDLQDAMGDANEAADPSGSRDPTATAQHVADTKQQGTDVDTGVDGAGGAKAGLSTLKDRASSNIPGGVKEKNRKTLDKSKNYLYDKMPQERREQTIWRLKKMVVEIQGHQDCKRLISASQKSSNVLTDQRAIETLLNLAETYAGHGQNLAGQSKGTVKGAHADDNLQICEADLKV